MRFRLSQLELLRDQYRGAPDSLFSHSAFHQLHRRNGAGGYWELWDGRRIRAIVHFTDVGDGVWRSPARGTFAGFLFDFELPLADLEGFAGEVLRVISAEGGRAAEVLLAPQAHDPVAFARQVYLLRRLGFDVSACDLNYGLSVDSRSLAERMGHGNRARLRKFLANGIIGRAASIAALPAIYRTLAANRESKGYKLSMTIDQLSEMIELFPDRVLLFEVPGESDPAAAAICLRACHHILYIFYWGDHPLAAKKSAVVALADSIYRWCQDQDISLLDVGTSTIDREPNHGLIEFKRGLGFEESLKLRMRKTL